MKPPFFSRTLGMWVVSSYRDVTAVLSDPAKFSSSLIYANAVASMRLTREARSAAESIIPLSAPHLAATDPPDHTQLRNVFRTPFTKTSVAQFEPLVREICNTLIDGFIADAQADLVEQFSARIPLISVLKFIGIPAEAIPQFSRWYRSWTRLALTQCSADEQLQLAEDLGRLHEYLQQFLAERKESPREDWISKLAEQMGSEEGAITPAEAINSLSHIIAAGTETTAFALSTILWRLLARRTFWEKMLESEETLTRTVEEGLRCNQSLRGPMRLTTEQVEVGGVVIPSGALVYAYNIAANRDESLFPDPDQFDPERKNLMRHITFGYGAHQCLGATLARLEIRIALEVLARRIPNLRLQQRPPEFSNTPIVRCLKHLFAEW